MSSLKRATVVLLYTVLINYAAQIPYYLHQYYFPYHAQPNWSGVALLALTFVWFLFGYVRYVRGKRYGWGLLLSFLVAQVIFYGYSVLLSFVGGGALAQLQTPSPFIRVIFSIGYLNFAVALYYVAWLLVKRTR